MRRSALVCISFIASLVFSHYFGMALGFAVFLIFVLGVIVFFIKKKNTALLSVIACAFLLGNIIMGGINTRYDILRERYDTAKASGRIQITEVLGEGRAYAKVKELNGIKQGAYFNILCNFQSGTFLQKGDVIEADLYLSKITDTENFPTAFYNEGKGTVLKAKATNAKIISSSPLWSFHSKLTSYIKSAYDRYFGDFAGLAKSLLLGTDGDLSDEYNDMLADLGIIHILSVSGLHFSILIGLFYTLLKSFKLSKPLTCTVVAVFSLFYMFLTAFSPSVCRAGIMSFFVIFDFIPQRQPDKLTTLCITGALMCLVKPTAALNISFQLSFLATFGLIAAANCILFPLEIKTEEMLFGKTVKNILTSVVFSFCAMFFCLAPIAHSFKSISVLSPVSNLICTPIAELILVLSFILLPLCILPHIARIFGILCQCVGHIFMFICSLVNNERYVLSLNNNVLPYVSLILTAATMLLFLIPFRRKKEALLVFITGSAVLVLICAFL